jgi:hypothetical protein
VLANGASGRRHSFAGWGRWVEIEVELPCLYYRILGMTISWLMVNGHTHRHRQSLSFQNLDLVNEEVLGGMSSFRRYDILNEYSLYTYTVLGMDNKCFGLVSSIEISCKFHSLLWVLTM